MQKQPPLLEHPLPLQVINPGFYGNRSVWEKDDYRDNVSRGLVASFDGHRSNVLHGMLTVDGRLAVTLGEDASCRIWSTRTELESRRFKLDGDDALCCCCLVDFELVITGSVSGNIQVWNIESGDLLRTSKSVPSPSPSPSHHPITQLIVSPTALNGPHGWCSKLIVSCSSNSSTASIWALETAQRVCNLGENSSVYHTDTVNCCKYSADFEFVLTGSKDCTAIIWKAETGQGVHKLLGHGDAIVALDAITDNNQQIMLTASRDRTARSWDVEKGECLRIFRGQAAPLVSLDASQRIHLLPAPSSTIDQSAPLLLTGSEDGTAWLFNARTGECIRKFDGQHKGPLTKAMFSPTFANIILTTAADGSACVWDGRIPAVDKTRKPECIRTIQGHRGSVLGATFSKDGTMFMTWSVDGTAKAWQYQDAVSIG